MAFLHCKAWLLLSLQPCSNSSDFREVREVGDCFVGLWVIGRLTGEIVIHDTISFGLWCFGFGSCFCWVWNIGALLEFLHFSRNTCFSNFRHFYVKGLKRFQHFHFVELRSPHNGLGNFLLCLLHHWFSYSHFLAFSVDQSFLHCSCLWFIFYSISTYILVLGTTRKMHIHNKNI